MSAVGDEGDLTRKQRREQARAERKALEEAHAASAARRTRLIQLAVAAVIIAAIIVGIVVATSGGGSKSSSKAETPAPQSPLVKEVTALLDGIPQSGTTLGSPSAPLTLEFYGDLECPICKEFALGALPGIIQNDVRPGKLKIEYRNLESATRERETFDKQQTAALAAGKQQKLWYYTELFYHKQGEENTEYVTEAYLRKLAEQVPGLSVSQWQTDRGDPQLAGVIETDAQKANNEGFTGTPSFLLGKTGGTLHKFEAGSYTDPAPYYKAIERLLKK